MRAFLTKLFAALPVDQCRHRIGKVGLRIGLRRAPLRFDENRPSRAQPPQGIVEPGGDGHEFGGRGTVEIGTAKARRALKRSVQLGRASCRERVCQYVWFLMVVASVKYNSNLRKHVQTVQ